MAAEATGAAGAAAVVSVFLTAVVLWAFFVACFLAGVFFTAGAALVEAAGAVAAAGAAASLAGAAGAWANDRAATLDSRAVAIRFLMFNMDGHSLIKR